MIGFNTLLDSEGVDPKVVKLVRHQDTRGVGTSPYDLWPAADSRFELYQRIQRRPVFQRASLIASFVATPLDETLFVGLYTIEGWQPAPPGLTDPLLGKDVGGYHLYDLEPAAILAEYRDRVVIDWGQGYRTWVQWAAKQNKQVLEMRRTPREPPFPGFLEFRMRLSELKTVPMSWRTALSSVSGVYLLTCPDTGKQYVGSAQGAGGLWGRWEEYVASGHGGNQKMKELPATDYQVSVLEVASSSTGSDMLGAIETRWKLKLLSRQFGLNAN